MSIVFVSLEEKSTAPEITSFGAGSDWGDGVAGALLVFEGFCAAYDDWDTVLLVVCERVCEGVL